MVRGPTETLVKVDPFAILNPGELYWRDHSEWLEQVCGYRLRPRFRPDWVPSWHADPRKAPFRIICEDAWSPFAQTTVDAVRIRDKADVFLKTVNLVRHPHEVEIGRFLTSLGPQRENHCVPILEILEPPDSSGTVILVMPLLRSYDSPKFDTFGEVVEMFRQLFEGMQFMHKHDVAHRDAHCLNIMMDGARLFPHGFHPDHQHLKPDKYSDASHTTRTWIPVKYYFVDFGISRRYASAQREGELWEPIIRSGDKSPPEHDGMVSADPFPTDVYLLGNFIKTQFIEGDGVISFGFHGFKFITALVQEMTQTEPTHRPTMDEVVVRFADIQKKSSCWKLRSRVVGKKESRWMKPPRLVMHWSRRFRSIAVRRPPLPVPSD
ncbi:Protein kinase domain-containing protein [Mycena indigotica]|uniref:Protein kinase domain-containing protein n=1 Tax=Mycena indigotica TaxID=2126181 RepID=A0A8H6TFL8_9AGAR|nr:Protein kinase domain-containing protein [Mycena indigotica]KAF7315847.1 Protein kinase domain-containing protein [Mycena indigotica]